MRLRPFILGALTLLLLGASAGTSCTFPWSALISDPLGAPITVRAINDSYWPVEVSLTSSAAVNAAASTQPSGGSTLDPDADEEWTFPCLTAPQVLALKATMAGDDNTADDTTSPSATSKTLHLNTDYECGSEVTFTVRTTAGPGLVVGHAVHQSNYQPAPQKIVMQVHNSTDHAYLAKVFLRDAAPSSYEQVVDGNPTMQASPTTDADATWDLTCDQANYVTFDAEPKGDAPDVASFGKFLADGVDFTCGDRIVFSIDLDEKADKVIVNYAVYYRGARDDFEFPN